MRGVLSKTFSKKKKEASQNQLTPRNDPSAEGGTRTPTGIHPLDPEPSASTNSATSAQNSVAASRPPPPGGDRTFNPYTHFLDFVKVSSSPSSSGRHTAKQQIRRRPIVQK